MKIALYGGCFDPITNGHIYICDQLLKSGLFDQVWLLPSYGSLYGKKISDPVGRIKMCELAIKDKGPNIIICDYEIRNQLIDESVNIIENFLADYARTNPDFQFYFVIGMDNANKIHTWGDWEKLVKMIPFVVVPRGNYDQDDEITWYKCSPHIFLGNMDEYPAISSTQVRESIKLGKPIHEYVCNLVMDYIEQHNMYQ